MMRVIFMGTPQYAVPTLKTLLSMNHVEVVAVYSQPPRPKGRGHHMQPSPVHVLALEENIDVYTPKSLRHEAVANQFKQHQADVAVVIAYGLLLPENILSIPKHGCVNLHGSLLPQWRGAAPVQRSLMMGDTLGGVTLIRMDKGMDTGDMVSKFPVTIEPHWTAHDLFEALSHSSASLIKRSLMPFLSNESAASIKQEDHLATYAPKIDKCEGKIVWDNVNYSIYNQWRGLAAWPGVWTHFGEDVLKLNHISLAIQEVSTASPGEIISLNPLVVACAEGSIHIHTLQKQGGKPMDAHSFLNGYPQLKIGEKFL
jgi:methionyl-tRNA formyltransferase